MREEKKGLGLCQSAESRKQLGKLAGISSAGEGRGGWGSHPANSNAVFPVNSAQRQGEGRGVGWCRRVGVYSICPALIQI